MQHKTKILNLLTSMLALALCLPSNAMDDSQDSQLSEIVENSVNYDTDDQSTYHESFATEDYLSPLYEENSSAFDDEQEND